MHDLFYMKLKWFHCSHEHYYGIGKLYVVILVDSSEDLFVSLEFAKPFGRTKFFPCKCRYDSEFSQIGTPHFSLEGVLTWDSLRSGKLNALRHVI